MAYSDELGVIFFHVAKNAGTSIINTLDLDDRGHILPQVMRKRYGRRRWNTYLKFSVVRNPWDRVVSNYKYAKMKKSYWHSDDDTRPLALHPDYELLKDKDFEECIDLLLQDKLNHQGWDRQYDWLSIDSKLQTDVILRMERLDEDWEKICNFLDIDKELRQDNVVNKNLEYRDYYTKETKKKVSKYYKVDVEIFDYSF